MFTHKFASILAIYLFGHSICFSYQDHVLSNQLQVEMTREPQIVDTMKRSIRKDGKKEFDREEDTDGSYLLPLSSFIRVPKNFRKILQRKNSSISTPLKTQQKGADNALPTNKIQVSFSFFIFCVVVHQRPTSTD